MRRLILLPAILMPLMLLLLTAAAAEDAAPKAVTVMVYLTGGDLESAKAKPRRMSARCCAPASTARR